MFGMNKHTDFGLYFAKFTFRLHAIHMDFHLGTFQRVLSLQIQELFELMKHLRCISIQRSSFCGYYVNAEENFRSTAMDDAGTAK